MVATIAMHLTRLRRCRLHQRSVIIAEAFRPFHNRQNTTSASDANSSDDGDAATNNASILFLSPSNWPEPNATAAGTRTMSLLRHFSAPASSFGSVHFGCGAKMPESLRSISESNTIHWHRIKPNRSEEMKKLLETIKNDHGPIQAVVFDRFYAEEAFSFRIREMCPNALLVLDMQDLHSLRIGRQCLVKEMDNHSLEADGVGNDENRLTHSMTKQLSEKVMEFDPSLSHEKTESKGRGKSYDTFLRELASVHRSDLVLVCSPAEMKLFESWNIPKWKLIPASFFCAEVGGDHALNRERGISSPSENGNPESCTFDGRKDFAVVGGFKHAPNVDSVELLRREIWPRIRERLPNAIVHVYGAYPTRHILAMHDVKSGFIVHGQVDCIDEVLLESRVLLAPLRFGAGIKGKIVDAWRCGCPVVTTPVGAEGTGEDETAQCPDGNQFENGTGGSDWGGTIASDTNDFVAAAVQLYTQEELWRNRQERGVGLLNQLFLGKVNLPTVENSICNAISTRRLRRRSDVVGAILWRDSQRSTEYFSKWIELKESLAANAES